MLADHFAVLGLSPSASPAEIKTAYRKLARSHHPDLNPTDSTSPDRFRAIQVAYETLTRPHLRQAYLEKRWYAQYRNQPLESRPLTLERILQRSIELERFVSSLDPHRMDRNGLTQHLQQQLSDWSSIGWNAEKELALAESIAALFIRCCRALTYTDCASLHGQLHQWFTQNQSAHLLDTDWLEKKKNAEKWQRLWPIAMILLTLVLVGVIWAASRSPM